jgi:hypothetical protein
MTENGEHTRCALCNFQIPAGRMDAHLVGWHHLEPAQAPEGPTAVPQRMVEDPEHSVCSVCTRPIPAGLMGAHMSSYHGDQGTKPAPARQTPSDDEDRLDPDSHVRVPMWLVIGLVLVAFIIFVKWSDSREDFQNVDPTRQGCSTAFGVDDC